MLARGADFVQKLGLGDLVLLQGDLGAGKTTLVRGMLRGLGYDGPVRSPSFNLVQVFATNPPVLHADLYRVESAQGLGIEDQRDTHLCLVEWPERSPELFEEAGAWWIQIGFSGDGRTVEIRRI